MVSFLFVTLLGFVKEEFNVSVCVRERGKQKGWEEMIRKAKSVTMA